VDELESIIRQTIVERLALPRAIKQIAIDAPLFGPKGDGGLDLDSLDSLEIMAALSDRFNLALDDVSPGDFLSISSLASYLRRHGVVDEASR
jgi:acyl carrier protein